MFKRFQPPASPEPETEETPSVMRHEESPELPDILPPLSQKNIGDVDFQTIQALLNKTKESPIYKTVQKIDSQNFYKN